jgi:TonB-linked SusC/RagA family outer membrane protein
MIFFKHRYLFRTGKWYKPILALPNIPYPSQKPAKALRFAVVIALINFFTVSAMAKAQQINLNLKNISLETVFNEIKKQTGYGFWYDKEDIATANKISVSLKNGSLKDALDQCLKNQPFTYEIFDKTIVVKQKAKTSEKKTENKINDIEIRGSVSDEKGNPLVGVNVSVVGTSKNTITDGKGQFSISVTNVNISLRFTYLGFSAVEQKVVKDIFLTIVLKEEPSTLNSVDINAGYYMVKDRERTGSIAKITSSTIEKQPINNILMGLQNRVPGLDIVQQSGVPGSGFIVQIRGRNSIGSGTQPLYIIDGVPYPSTGINTANSSPILQSSNPLSLINPNDIQSVEILKDADATAIYGSRGANGIILITTKKGISGELKVNANISQGFSQVGREIDLMNTQEYLSMRMEAFRNDNLSPSATDYDVNGVWDKTKYTDWQKELIGGTANVTNASVSISGGNKNSKYLVSGNHYREGTVFPGSFGFKRTGAHTNLDFGADENRFKANFTATYSNSTSNLMSTDLTSYITLAPNAPDPYNEYGKLNWNYNGSPLVFNPMSFLLYTIDANTDNLIANANLRYRISKVLELKTSIGYTSIKREEIAKSPLEGLSPSYGPTPADRSSQFGNTSNNSWLVEPQLTFEKKINNGKLQALIGATLQQTAANYRNIRGSNFNSDELLDNIASASVFSITQSDSYIYRYGALFARFNYNLQDKYFFNITARRDASSRFGSGNQIANFGAIGMAWIFSEEKFIRNSIPIISFGKLRASFGSTGNDQISDYQYLQLYNSSTAYQGIPTLITSRISNPNYGWENNNKLEAALQLGFLEDKVSLQTAYFRNRSSNQLVGNPLPPSVGATIINANLPAIVQNSGWEFDTSIQIINNSNWHWSTNFNISLPKNRLVEYPGLSTSSNSTLYIVGEPLNIKRYLNTYVDPLTGLYVFEDVDKNGLQNDLDRYLNKFIGQSAYGGLGSTISYKLFSLDILFSFSKTTGFSYLNNLSYAPGYFSSNIPLNNQTKEVLERWQKQGDVSDIPKFSTTTPSYLNFLIGKSNGTQSLADNSFVRLKNVSLSYKMPKKILSIVKVDNAELSVQGQNIFTITRYPGLDPENSQLISRLPPLRTFLFGLKVAL